MDNMKIFTDNIEQEAITQLEKIKNHPAFKNQKIRIMPDVHAGKGCVIGFTSTYTDKIVPNIVGVDIGCGVTGVNLGNIDVDLEKLDRVIRKNIPAGREVRTSYFYSFHRLIGAWVVDKLPYLHDKDRIKMCLGTLGGGNHYIELDQSESGDKYIVVHSGSRNLGVQVAKHYQEIAISKLFGKEKLKQEMDALIEQYKKEGRQQEISKALEELKNNFYANNNFDKDLAYLEGQDLQDYLRDMQVVQTFARINRDCILSIIAEEMGWSYEDDNVYKSVHNYIDTEEKIIRKGAISAEKGLRVIIPLNMRDGVIIGTGKGNSDWNMSAPHGAGRLMSRAKAKETIKLEDFQESMKDIYTTSVCEATIDESPFAYKPAQEIIDKIQDTVEILEVLKPIYNFKAGD